MGSRKKKPDSQRDILPIPKDQRPLTGISNFAIWFSCNLVTTTMLTGMLLVPGLTLESAVMAIAIGCILGVIPLVLIGAIGQKTGLVTMVAMRGVFGVRGADIPSVINMLTLIAWSWAQAALGGIALDYAVNSLTGYSNQSLFIILTESIVLVVALFAVEGIAAYEKIAMVFIAVVMGAVIYKAVAHIGMGNLMSVASQPAKDMSFMIALDLVIALSLSWAPLSADYNRDCKTMKGAVLGTGIGYTLGTVLSMGSGALMIAMILVKGSPAIYEPSRVFGEIGFGIVGALVIFMSIIAANVMCIYSATVSFQNIFPKFKYRITAIAIGIICIIGALFSGILGSFQSFVYLIGVLFMPIFIIMIADYYVLQKRNFDIEAIVHPEMNDKYHYKHGVNWIAVGVFLVVAGFTYYIAYIHPLPTGASIPSSAATFFLYIGAMKVLGKKKKAGEGDR